VIKIIIIVTYMTWTHHPKSSLTIL